MTAWSQATVESVIEDVRGALAAEPDAPGGNVPDRIRRLVRAAGIRLWGFYDWDFRRVEGTLTVTAADDDIDVPADFAKLDVRWMREQDTQNSLQFFSDARQWRRVADHYDATDTGSPRFALVESKTSATGFEQQFKLVPIPDDSYTFRYVYILRDPWSHPTEASRLVDTQSPQWPADFDEGWRLLATSMGYLQFMPGSERTGRARGTAQRWLQDAVSNLNETITGGDTEDRIISGYGDEGASLSRQYLYNDDYFPTIAD